MLDIWSCTCKAHGEAQYLQQLAVQLLEKGRSVVAAARDAAKAKEVFIELGLSEGQNKGFGQVTAAALLRNFTD